MKKLIALLLLSVVSSSAFAANILFTGDQLPGGYASVYVNNQPSQVYSSNQEMHFKGHHLKTVRVVYGANSQATMNCYAPKKRLKKHDEVIYQVTVDPVTTYATCGLVRIANNG